MTSDIILSDDRSRWQPLKKQSKLFAQAYSSCANFFGIPDFIYWSKLVNDCASSLTFDYCSDGSKHLVNANFCKDRFCPMCNDRRFKQLFHNLSVALDKIQEHSKHDFIFGTLTLKNIPADKLSGTIEDMNHAWDLLLKRLYRVYSAPNKKCFDGCISVLEVTSSIVDDVIMLHPHFHFVLSCDPSYWVYHYEKDENGKRKRVYHNLITNKQLSKMWGECLGISYNPNTHIRRADITKYARSEIAKSNRYMFETDDEKNNRDLAEYLFKFGDYPLLKEHPEILGYLKLGLSGSQRYRTSGLFRTYFKDINEEDLVNRCNIRADLLGILETYKWCGIRKNYFLET